MKIMKDINTLTTCDDIIKHHHQQQQQQIQIQSKLLSFRWFCVQYFVRDEESVFNENMFYSSQ